MLLLHVTRLAAYAWVLRLVGSFNGALLLSTVCVCAASRKRVWGSASALQLMSSDAATVFLFSPEDVDVMRCLRVCTSPALYCAAAGQPAPSWSKLQRGKLVLNSCPLVCFSFRAESCPVGGRSMRTALFCMQHTTMICLILKR